METVHFSSRERAMSGTNEGRTSVITQEVSVTPPDSSMTALPLIQQHQQLQQLRHELLLKYRPVLQQGAGPIRVMARMVAELQQRCRELHIAEEVMQTEIINRTIGDVDVRKIVEAQCSCRMFRAARFLVDLQCALEQWFGLVVATHINI